MAVKLDVLINYIFDNAQLKRSIAQTNKRMRDAFNPLSQSTVANKNRNSVKELILQANVAAEHFNKTLENTLAYIKTLNKEGKLGDLARMLGLEAKDKKGHGTGKLTSEGEKIVANKYASDIVNTELQLEQEELDARERAEREVEAKQKAIDDAAYAYGARKMLATDEKLEAQLRDEFIRKKRNELAELKKRKREEAALEKANYDNIQEQSKLDDQINKAEEKLKKLMAAKAKAEAIAAAKKQIEEEKKKQRALNLLLGRWGKLGIYGYMASKAIQFVSKAMNFAYQTSMQGLDWQRTISGGAAGGVSFGQGLAAYQRAGIGANAYQGFRRGIQGYLGQVKLGMGNAAPLMYLGISAIDKLDDTEKQIEKALRRIGDESASLALAQQMGLSYEMWEAIYSGRLDRERSMYSEQAIQQWAELAKGFNEILTEVKTLFFNYFAPYAAAFGEFLQKLSEGKTGISSAIDIGTGFVSKVPQIAFRTVEVIVKNENGEVVGKGEAQPYIDAGFQVPQQGS